MSFSPDIGVWIAAILSIGILSFLYADNPLYKLCESIFIGVSAGYLFVVEVQNVIISKLVHNLAQGNLWYLIPGVLGGEGAIEQESFSEPLLEYPQYTRPPEFRGMKVPDELLTGNHAAIAKWRRKQSEKRTAERRPDLLNNRPAETGDGA